MSNATITQQSGALAHTATTSRRKHVLDLDDFSRDEIGEILETTAGMKEVLGRAIKQVPALRGKTVVNMFFEDSTRTRISFELAAKALSANVVAMTGKGSSVEKGESLIDTVRTLQALGADMIVLRHGESGAPYLVARHFRGSVLNAGDGRHAHPTQALLDLFTINEKLGRDRGPQGGDRRRYLAQPGRPLEFVGPGDYGRARHTLRAAYAAWPGGVLDCHLA